MKIVDANVLIYATNELSGEHFAAKTWLDDALSRTEPVFIPWMCLLAYVRVNTNPRAVVVPLTVDEAMDDVDSWLAAPPVRTELPSVAVAPALRRMLNTIGTGGNIVNDAWLAALAVGLNAEIVSFDRDFGRFPSVRWLNPSVGNESLMCPDGGK
ncbi:MAG: PIN domain-containing protein [Propionibacteriaceae bacterium]|jgi:toxin-antitoxin system PIN domain toxin|nr:PIN domain-containing protein [Propionibacteriaceae bacterium]